MSDLSFMPNRKEKFLALIIALLIQGVILVCIFWVPSEASQGRAKAAGTGGIEISLGPAGRAAGGPKQQDGVERGVEQTDPKPKSLTKPEPQPEIRPDPEPKAAPKSEPKSEITTEAAPKPDSVTKLEAEPVARQDIQTKTQTVLDPELTSDSAPQVSLAGASGKSGSRNAEQTGSGDNTAGGGLPGETKDYSATLLAWLEKHREYPRRARMRRQEGTVLLYFVIDREGRVLDQRIETSSGFSILDQEVLRMLERAQPLPRMPEKLHRETLELMVPVQFYLR